MCGARIMNRWRAGLLLLLLSMLGLAQAQVAVDSQRLERGNLALTRQVAVLLDPQGTLTFEQVRAADAPTPWAEGGLVRGHPLGIRAPVVWLRLALAATDDAPMDAVLHVDNPSLVEVQAIIHGVATPVQVGRRLAFPLQLSAKRPPTVYLRLASQNLIQPVLSLSLATRFQAQEHAELIVQAVLAGAMFSMVLYNLLLWMTMRERLYWHNFSYSALMSVSVNASTDLASGWLPQQTAGTLDWTYSIGLPLAMVCMLQFLQSLLGVRERWPWTSRLMNLGSVVYLLLPWVAYRHPAIFNASYPLVQGVTVLALLGVLVVAMVQRIPGAFLTLCGYGFLAVSTQLYPMAAAGLLPTDLLTENGILIGATLQMVLLAAALGSRFHFFKQNSDDAQARALWAEKQLVDELRSSERSLEEKVQMRTQALLTTQKELEAAKEKAEAGTQAKSAFLATMSHEIRTPLNAIVGMAYLLLHTKIDDKARNYATKISGAATNLQVIVDDILDFSKLEANKLELEQIGFAMDDLLVQMNDLFASRAASKNLVLRYELAPDLPGALVGDPVRIGQIWTNLVGNALKFTQVGEVVLGVDVVHQSRHHAELRFWVRDTGIGIAKDQCDQIFQPFNQADSTVNRHYGGSGLGLAICKRLVDLMDGRIDVESEVGVGSTFSFQVSLGIQAALADPDTVPQRLQVDASDTAGLRILVVEDDALNMEVTTDLLTAAGMTVEVAHNGQECLDLMGLRRFDLVLMDCQMPVMDGYTATKIIRSQPVWVQLPVLALTANVTTESVEMALAAGMNAVIAKPINPHTALRTITNWIHRGGQGKTDFNELG